MTGRFCKHTSRCSAKPRGPCGLWASCPIFEEENVVAKIIKARAAVKEKEKLQSTAKK